MEAVWLFNPTTCVGGSADRLLSEARDDGGQDGPAFSLLVDAVELDGGIL